MLGLEQYSAVSVSALFSSCGARYCVASCGALELFSIFWLENSFLSKVRHYKGVGKGKGEIFHDPTLLTGPGVCNCVYSEKMVSSG